MTAPRGRGFESVWPIIVIPRETTCSCKQTQEKRDQRFWQAMKSVEKIILTINPIIILLAFHNHIHMCKLINQNILFLLFSQKCWFCHYHVPFLWQCVLMSFTQWLLYFNLSLKIHEHTNIHTASFPAIETQNKAHYKRQLCSYTINASAFVLKYVNQQHHIHLTFWKNKMPIIHF